MFGYYMAETGNKAGQGKPGNLGLDAVDDDAGSDRSEVERQLEEVKQLEEQVKTGKMK